MQHRPEDAEHNEKKEEKKEEKKKRKEKKVTSVHCRQNFGQWWMKLLSDVPCALSWQI